MSWKDRTREFIKLTSPDGNEFEAKWRGDRRTVAKKLGIFSYPRLNGQIVQDLGVDSNMYPLTFFFDGTDHDKEANRFFKAAGEVGQWEVIHPTRGFLGLQLVSVVEEDQPVTSGGITEVTAEWIEPIDPTSLKTSAELLGDIAAQIGLTNLSASNQFVDQLKQQPTAAIAALNNAVESIQIASNTILGPIAAVNSDTNALYNAVNRGITDTLNATVLQPLSLASQLQELTQLPALAVRDVSSRLEAYAALANSIFGSTPTKSDAGGFNEALVQELVLASITCANASVLSSGPDNTSDVSTGGFNSKSEALDAAQRVTDQYGDILDALDNTQDVFANVDIDEQYISQSQSQSDTRKVTSLGLQYLLSASYNLRVERRFKLDRPRAPIEITITSYGSLGDNDSNLDLFIDSNRLTGKDVLLLPAGREVVVYA